LDLSGRKWEAGEDCTVRSYNLYASPYIIKMIASRRRRGRGHVAHIGEMRNILKVSVRKPEGKWPLRRPWRRCEDNVRMDCREMGWKVADWMHLTQNRNEWQALMNMVMNLLVP
jgi:hypothetical protein